MHLTYKYTREVESKKMKNMHYANRKHKKAAMSMLKSGKVDFKTRSISEFKYIKQI